MGDVRDRFTAEKKFLSGSELGPHVGPGGVNTITVDNVIIQTSTYLCSSMQLQFPFQIEWCVICWQIRCLPLCDLVLHVTRSVAITAVMKYNNNKKMYVI